MDGAPLKDVDGRLAEVVELKRKVAAEPTVEACLDLATKYRLFYQSVGADERRAAALWKRLGMTYAHHHRYLRIAEASELLAGFRHALPPTVEPLYEVALAAMDANGPENVRAAVEAHRLTPGSSVRAIRKMRPRKKKRLRHRRFDRTG
jgi:hypothetical protein